MDEKKLSFNKALEELEKILDQIENGNLDIDLLSGKVKRASELIKFCKGKLRSTEEDIGKILEDMG